MTPVPGTASGPTFSDRQWRQTGLGGCRNVPQSRHRRISSLPSAPPVQNARFSASSLGKGRFAVISQEPPAQGLSQPSRSPITQFPSNVKTLNVVLLPWKYNPKVLTRSEEHT